MGQKSDKGGQEKEGEKEIQYEFEQHLVPALPPSKSISNLSFPWDDDEIITADTRYIMQKKNIHIE